MIRAMAPLNGGSKPQRFDAEHRLSAPRAPSARPLLARVGGRRVRPMTVVFRGPPHAERSARVRGRAGERALSFVEVVVAVLLLGILLLVAVPRLLAPDELDVEVVARQVAADMHMARRLAIALRSSYVVSFSPPTPPYTSYTLTTGGVDEPDFPKDLPTQVIVTGTPSVTFRPSGATSAAALITFTAGASVAQVEVLQTTGRAVITGP